VLDRSEGELNALNKEIELMQRLSHSRLVKFFGAGKFSHDSSFGVKGTMFLVTELLQGGDLGSLLSDPDAIQRWRWESRLQILIDIVRGMCYLHVHDVAHRDLKPANVLLDRKKERAKVADFGLAKLLLHKSSSSSSSSRQKHKKRGVKSALSHSDLETAGGVEAATGLLGSGPYMAPELWDGRMLANVDPFKVDVYALAITMWQVMEAPQLPYVDQGWNPSFTYQLAHMVGEQEMRPIYDKDPVSENRRPAGFTKLMEAGWEQDAKQRPTMKTMLEGLERMYGSLIAANE
jgi:serine/threonine protein kinase